MGARSRFAFSKCRLNSPGPQLSPALLLFLLLSASGWLLPASINAQYELGSEDDLTVLGVSATAEDPDVEIKGFTVFGSTQTSYTGAVVAPGNVVVNGVLSVSSGAYFVGNSTFTGAGKIFINDGSAGQLLRKNAAGYLEWNDATAVGDNLGNHVATSTLQMGIYGVNTSSSITAARYQINGSTVLSTGVIGPDNITTGSGISIGNGNNSSNALSVAMGFSNTASGLLSVAVGYTTKAEGTNAVSIGNGISQNLGTSAVAVGYQTEIESTESGLFNIGRVNTIGAGLSNVGLVGSNLTASGSKRLEIGVNDTAKITILTGGNVGISSTTPAYKLVVSSGAGESGNMLVISTGSSNVIRMTGAGEIYANKLYGDGSGITNLAGAGDNLGNHIATMTLTANYGVATTSITASTGSFSGYVNAGSYLVNNSTMVAILPGTNSIAYGVNAGTSNVVGGDDNLFVGNSAGASNTTGDGNTFIGSGAGYSNRSPGAGDGEWNLFVGYKAGYSNTTGSYNVFLGATTGSNNTTGVRNIFISEGAGQSNTTGSYNSIIGHWAGAANTTGASNSFFGRYAGRSNVAGGKNSYMGESAGHFTQAGSANAVFGYQAGYGVTGNSFSSSTLVGYYAGRGLTTGSDNIFLGWQAGYTTTSGAGNIIIGYNQRASAPAASNELNLGGVIYGDLSAKTVGISTRVPQAALDIVSTGTASNVYAQIWRGGNGVIVASMTSEGTLYATIPPSVGAGDNLGNHIATTTLQMGAYGVNTSSNITAARYQINGSTVLAILPGAYSLAVGPNAGRSNTAAGERNAYFGNTAGYSTVSGDDNVFIGHEAGYYNVSGSWNFFLGTRSGMSATGNDNIFIGSDSGYSQTTASGNMFVGSSAGYNNVDGFQNMFMGYNSGYRNLNGAYNTYAGYQSGYYNVYGHRNSVFGHGAAQGTVDGTIGDNAIFGYQAGKALTSGSYNVLMGSLAGDSLTTGAGNIIIGYDKDAPTATTNNHLNIGGAIYGDLSTGNVGIGTTTPGGKLEVNGNIKLSGASATYKITNVALPTANTDVATKEYVDAAQGPRGPAVAISAETAGTYTHPNAAKYCYDLSATAAVAMDGNTTTTYTDWRLPSVEEAAVFEGTIASSSYLWTATISPDPASASMWIALALSGAAWNQYGNASAQKVRCVR